VNGFNVVTVIVRSVVTGKDSSCFFNMPAHWSTMQQINMIPHLVTLNKDYWKLNQCNKILYWRKDKLTTVTSDMSSKW